MQQVLSLVTGLSHCYFVGLKGLGTPALMHRLCVLYALICFVPMSSLFLTSSAMFLRAVATEHTTRSLSIRSSSTRMGSPFSFRTAARMYAANCLCKKKKAHTH